MNSLSDVKVRVLKNIYTATLQSTLEYGAITFGIMASINIDRLQVSRNQGMRLILGVQRGISAKMMRHELRMLPVEHRAKLSRTKLYRYGYQVGKITGTKMKVTTRNNLLTKLSNSKWGAIPSTIRT